MSRLNEIQRMKRAELPDDEEELRLEMQPLDIDAGEFAPKTPLGERLAAWTRRTRWFLALVILPTLLAGVYFTVIAADRYEVETRFIVRSPAAGSGGDLSSLLQGTGFVRSTDDTFAVHAFMRSRDIIGLLEKEIGLRSLIGRSEADILWRYPRIWPLPDSSEHFWRHVQDFVAIDFDQSTGISTLRVTAFRPEDARTIALGLLSQSEQLINRLSDRAQRDSVTSSEVEVERARNAAREAQQRVTDFRMREEVVDPARATNTAFEIISRMTLETAQTNSQLAEVLKTSPQSSQVGSLRVRIAALEEQIAKERRILAGDDKSMATRIAEYEQLTLEREFAERTFQTALATLSAARQESQRQRLFLETIASPTAPDYPRYPHRFLGILLTFCFTYLLYLIARRLFADIESHAEV